MTRPKKKASIIVKAIHNKSLAALLALAVFMLAPMVNAADKTQTTQVALLGTYEKWTAFKAHENGTMVCFMAAKPQTVGRAKQRSSTHFMITHRPSENSLGVIHVNTGYKLLLDSEVLLTINKVWYRLFTDGANAWARDSVMDRKIVQAMRRSKGNMSIQGIAKNGKTVKDIYDLSGVSAAWKAINQACGVNPD